MLVSVKWAQWHQLREEDRTSGESRIHATEKGKGELGTWLTLILMTPQRLGSVTSLLRNNQWPLTAHKTKSETLNLLLQALQLGPRLLSPALWPLAPFTDPPV